MNTLPGQVKRPAIVLETVAAFLVALLGAPTLASSTRGTPVTVQGTLQFVHGDDFAHRHGRTYAYYVQTSHGKVQLSFAKGTAPSLDMAGFKVRVNGSKVGRTVYVGGSSGGSVTTVSSSTVTSPQTRNVLVLMFNFSNDRSTPWTQDFVRGIVFNNANSIAAYYSEESYGQLSMTGNVTPRLQISNDNSLEYRQPYGTYFDNFGPSDPAVNGITIRMGYDYSSLTQSQLLDTTPGTSSYSDSSLGVGRSVTDPTTNITFTNVSESSTGAAVNISFGADTVKPTAPGNLQANPTGASSVSLTWTASSDNVGVAGYRVYRDGGSTPIASPTSPGYTDTGLSAQTTYSYSVVAYDAQNNVSDPSTESATTPLFDTTPPRAPGTLSYQKLSGGKFKLSWGAASDNVQVGGHMVYRNNALLATLAGATLTYTDRPPKGTMSYYVVAYDTSNNLGPASNTVTVATARTPTK